MTHTLRITIATLTLAITSGCANLPPWAALRLSIGWSTMPDYPPQARAAKSDSPADGSHAHEVPALNSAGISDYDIPVP